MVLVSFIIDLWKVEQTRKWYVVRTVNIIHNSCPIVTKELIPGVFSKSQFQIIIKIQSLLWFFPQRRKSRFVNWISEIGYFFSFVLWKGPSHQFFSVFKWKKKPLGFSEKTCSTENKTYLVKLCHFLAVSFYSEGIKVCAYPVT